ncbi:MAG: hypothetical protein L6Q99_10465 [Planctomycetes bacterium]|nr:hypothetical protein [Planctomycetota bacterium]
MTDAMPGGAEHGGHVAGGAPSSEPAHAAAHTSAPVRDANPRHVRVILWLAALFVCALGFPRALDTWHDQVLHPVDLVLESPSLATLDLLRDGANPYDPEVYAGPPFWLSMYTPLYYQLVAALPSHPDNPFFTGRLVDLACVVGLFALLFFVRQSDKALALLACGAFVLVRVVINNAALFKNDFLGIFLSACAVVLADRARGRTGWIVVAALAAALGFWCKQSFLAAAAACGLFFLLNSFRQALLFGAVFAASAGLLLGGALLVWGRGFWFSVFEAPQNPLNGDVFRGLWLEMLIQPVAMLNLAAALVLIGWAFVREKKAAFASDPFALYTLVSAAVLMATVGKEGAGANYFNEWEFGALLVLVRWVPKWIDATKPVLAAASFASVFVLGSVAEVALAERNQYSYTTSEISPQARALSDFVGARVTALAGENPRLLNLYSASIVGRLPATVEVNDPFLYGLLWGAGKLDPERLREAIRSRRYDGILAPPGILDGIYPYPPPLLRALQRNYRLGERIPAGDRPFDVLVRQPDSNR